MSKEAAIGTTLGLVGASGSIVAGIWAMGEATNTKNQIQTYQDQITKLENERPPIVNPYSGVTNLSSLLNNTYENLGVATKSAEFQAQETDVALANTLDTLRVTGAGAGGATALAQAALRSKQGIAANLEQQEAQNNKLRAQGAAQLQQAKFAEAQRVQMAGVEGQKYMFATQDARKMQELNRAQAMLDQQRANQLNYETQAMTAFGSAFSGMGSLGGSLIAGSGGGTGTGG